MPRVLLVEDEDHLAAGIRFNLELDGYDVETIADGLRAVERLAPPPEGPVWDAERAVLLFVDIMRGDVHVFNPATASDRVVNVGLPVGAVAPTLRGDWIAAAGQGFHRVDPGSGRRTLVADAAPGRTDLRMNDGYVDPLGNFWAGTLSLERTPNRAHCIG